MEVLEKEIERKLKKMIERHGGRCLKWVCPGWAGVPDRLCLLPGGRIIFIETKRPKGSRIDALQIKWRKWLTDLGFLVGYVFDEADVLNLELLIRGRAPDGLRADFTFVDEWDAVGSRQNYEVTVAAAAKFPPREAVQDEKV